MSQSAKSVTLASHYLETVYTNWRGETGLRRIVPISVRLGSTEWHPGPQWLLRGVDLDRGEEREFALKDFGRPPLPVEVLDIFLDCNADGTPPDVLPEDMDSPLGRRWLEMFRLMKEVCGISRQTTGRVLEQADMLDGRVAQTVRMPNGEEIVRHVPATVAYSTELPNGVELRATVHHGPRPANDDRQEDILYRGRAE